MNPKTTVACILLLLSFTLFISCRTGGDSALGYSESLDEWRLVGMLSTVKAWPTTATNDYSEDDWKHLFLVARVIQKCNPVLVERDLRAHQMGMGKTTFDFQCAVNPEDDSKLFLLMRVIFKIPESPRPQRELIEFGGWEWSPSLFNPDGTANFGWPVNWKEEHPILTATRGGIQGIDARYDASAEFRYFLAKYPMRDLSSL